VLKKFSRTPGDVASACSNPEMQARVAVLLVANRVEM
jgi:hypothetical protein